MVQQVKFSPYEGGRFVAEDSTTPAQVPEHAKRFHLDDTSSISGGTHWEDNNIPIFAGLR